MNKIFFVGFYFFVTYQTYTFATSNIYLRNIKQALPEIDGVPNRALKCE